MLKGSVLDLQYILCIQNMVFLVYIMQRFKTQLQKELQIIRLQMKRTTQLFVMHGKLM